ncbi:hypothetical protein GCM10010399_90220 [Dactylosporangium fulvum]|uniref:Uncharacterized protein n=1 Tax=Dactylosporangium fulvum TaxID=53359 RepID=A0ABY5WCC6_9ACTN|nr:hypothetical protein [Dactylosporangium fulvum]UWP87114.1 hypothetical protein Dfulv_23885 [Dactylosporangium fulvum]
MTDDDRPAERRSAFMAWLRRRFRVLGGAANAVSHADMGPYAGAPRNPALHIGDGQGYSTIRYTTEHVAYTSITTNTDGCPRCGRPLAETHEMARSGDGTAPEAVGAVRICRGCETGEWLERSRMPRSTRARDSARRNVV